MPINFGSFISGLSTGFNPSATPMADEFQQTLSTQAGQSTVATAVTQGRLTGQPVFPGSYTSYLVENPNQLLPALGGTADQVARRNVAPLGAELDRQSTAVDTILRQTEANPELIPVEARDSVLPELADVRDRLARAKEALTASSADYTGPSAPLAVRQQLAQASTDAFSVAEDAKRALETVSGQIAIGAEQRGVTAAQDGVLADRGKRIAAAIENGTARELLGDVDGLLEGQRAKGRAIEGRFLLPRELAQTLPLAEKEQGVTIIAAALREQMPLIDQALTGLDQKLKDARASGASRETIEGLETLAGDLRSSREAAGKLEPAIAETLGSTTLDRRTRETALGAQLGTGVTLANTIERLLTGAERPDEPRTSASLGFGEKIGTLTTIADAYRNGQAFSAYTELERKDHLATIKSLMPELVQRTELAIGELDQFIEARKGNPDDFAYKQAVTERNLLTTALTFAKDAVRQLPDDLASSRDSRFGAVLDGGAMMQMSAAIDRVLGIATDDLPRIAALTGARNGVEVAAFGHQVHDAAEGYGP